MSSPPVDVPEVKGRKHSKQRNTALNVKTSHAQQQKEPTEETGYVDSAPIDEPLPQPQASEVQRSNSKHKTSSRSKTGGVAPVTTAGSVSSSRGNAHRNRNMRGTSHSDQRGLRWDGWRFRERTSLIPSCSEAQTPASW
ncbi:hypothetical protein ACMFMG_007369 [Clarireedia jacksonii]